MSKIKIRTLKNPFGALAITNWCFLTNILISLLIFCINISKPDYKINESTKRALAIYIIVSCLLLLVSLFLTFIYFKKRKYILKAVNDRPNLIEKINDPKYENKYAANTVAFGIAFVFSLIPSGLFIWAIISGDGGWGAFYMFLFAFITFPFVIIFFLLFFVYLVYYLTRKSEIRREEKLDELE